MLADVSLIDILWSLFVLFLMVQYLIITFVVIFDVFISDDLSGGMKAVWLVALLVFPVIALIIYVVTRGDGLGKRRLARQQRAQPAGEALPPGIPPPPLGPVAELQQAQALLDAGAITPEEYSRLKSRVLMEPDRP